MSAFQDWLIEIADTAPTIDVGEVGLDDEARTNQWGFSFTQEQVQSLSSQEVTAFLDSIVDIYSRWLSQPDHSNRMVFYCWFDAQASELRFSLVSASHGALPFGCAFETVNSSAQIVDSFLNSFYHNGLPLDEFVDLDNAEPNNVHDVPLQIWVKELPLPNRI